LGGGDMRYVINMLDIAYVTFFNKEKITLEDLQNVFKGNYLQDKNEDDHYDNLSALQKSIRGSDVDAALFYLAKLCVSEDLISIERRLTVIAYEDVGFGNPAAVDRTINAINAAKNLGFPEAIIPLGFAVCDLALSPKSRSSCDSMHAAFDFAKNHSIPVQHYLKYTPVNVDDIDKYPYDRPDLWERIQYLPDVIANMKFYEKRGNSKYDEALFNQYLKLRSVPRSNNLRKLKSKK
jgi:putative ATPase